MTNKKVISVWKKAPYPSLDYFRRFAPAAAVLSALVISECSLKEENENENAPSEEETDTNENEEAAENEAEAPSEPSDYGVGAGHPEAEKPASISALIHLYFSTWTIFTPFW